jgi:hypothetical protein
MRSPTLVANAIFAPGTCMICGSNEGEMVDTGVDIPGDGRMYLCVRWCAPRIAGLIGESELPSDIKRCAATRVDGKPCMAWALAGQEFCVAHRKQQRKEHDHELVALSRD